MIAILFALFTISFEYIKITSAASEAITMPPSNKKATCNQVPFRNLFRLTTYVIRADFVFSLARSEPRVQPTISYSALSVPQRSPAAVG
jgi:hypothetical protein